MARILQINQKIKALQKGATKSKLGGSKQKKIHPIKPKKSSKTIITEIRESADSQVFFIENRENGEQITSE